MVIQITIYRSHVINILFSMWSLFHLVFIPIIQGHKSNLHRCLDMTNIRSSPIKVHSPKLWNAINPQEICNSPALYSFKKRSRCTLEVRTVTILFFDLCNVNLVVPYWFISLYGLLCTVTKIIVCMNRLYINIVPIHVWCQQSRSYSENLFNACEMTLGVSVTHA